MVQIIRLQPFPLWAYLHLLETSGPAAFNNYCEGAKLLSDWLKPIELPPVDTDIKIPQIAVSYLMQEIAKIIALQHKSTDDSFDTHLQKINKTIEAIHTVYITQGHQSAQGHQNEI